MCYAPNLIRNPLYGTAPFSLTKDVTSCSIYVPCGKCGACRSRKQTDILQRVQLETLRSYVYYFTLTYNEQHVPRYTLSNGVTLMHPNYKHITDMFKRIRANRYFGDRRIKYIVCSEYTPTRARPHYHGLLFVEKLSDDSREIVHELEQVGFQTILQEWRVNVATMVAKKDSRYYKKGDIIANKRKPVYEPLCTYVRRYRNGKLNTTYDFKLCLPMNSNGTNDVSYYVTKYLFKDSKQYKRIQALCYKTTANKQEAQQLIQKVFRTGYAKSLNTGGLFTDDSYQQYRHYASLSQNTQETIMDQYEDSNDMPDFDSEDLPADPVDYSTAQAVVCPKTVLVHDERLYNKVLQDAKISLMNNKTISFSDIYTGKDLPISRSLLVFLPEDIVVSHQKLVQQIVKNKSLDFDKMEKTKRRYENLSKNVFATDLFDDDELLSFGNDDSLQSVSLAESDSRIYERSEIPQHIEPAYEDWGCEKVTPNLFDGDPWKDFFKTSDYDQTLIKKSKYEKRNHRKRVVRNSF